MANTTRLPASGRVGEPPGWPLGADEPGLWADLWATPQSVEWERLGWLRVVARYALLLVEIELSSSASMAAFGEARQLEDRLGLSPMSMVRLRWEIESDDEVAAPRVAPSGPKRRLKAV